MSEQGTQASTSTTATGDSSADARRSIRYVAKDANRDGASISKMRLPFSEAMGTVTPFFDIRIMEGRRIKEKYDDLLPSEIRKILGSHAGDAVLVDALAKLEASNDAQVEGRFTLPRENELRMAIGGADKNDGVLPPMALRAFVQKGNEFYYSATPDRLAFVDNGTSLRTKENSAAVAAALVSISVARGWESITVAGTEDFRRLVWMDAARQGVEVLGYAPTPDDMKKAGIERKPGRTAAPQIDTEDISQVAAAPASVKAPPPDRFTGKLVDHGPAPYKDDPNEGMSYFAKLETARGPVIHWGKGVKSAIAAADAEVGDTIRLEKTSAREVEAPISTRDDDGQVTGKEWAPARRNEWSATLVATMRPRPVASDQDPSERAEGQPNDENRRASAAAALRLADPKAPELFPELGTAVTAINTVKQTVEKDLQGQQPNVVAKVVSAARRVLADQVEQGSPISLDAGVIATEDRQRRQERAARR